MRSRSLLHLILGLFFSLTLVTACTKDRDDETIAPVTPSHSTLRDLLADHIEQESQSYTVNATSGGTIIGDRGTHVTFPPSGFQNASGELVTGEVQVQLLEASDLGDMIWINVQTVGDDNGTDRMLQSGGQIRVTATLNGDELRLGPLGMDVQMVTDEPFSISGLFTANAPRDSGMVWTLADPVAVTMVSDTSWTDSALFVFHTDSLQWVNCDDFPNISNITSVTASIAEGQTIDSMMVWIALPQYNAVMNMRPTSDQVFTTWSPVPCNRQATVVGLYRFGAQYYSAFIQVFTSSGMNVPLSFTPTTLAQFQQDIDGI